jgi:RNA polymerase sigma factor (sigma-70 family)
MHFGGEQMVSGLLPIFLRRLRKSLTAAGDGTGDADLLERFLARRDEAAFAALVGRHGPMVLGVCGRVLGDAHAAEDAFQATFLILVRRAGAIRKRASLGSWLHGVAYRAALKARARAACRRRHERQAMHPEPMDPATDFVWRDLWPVLDAALDRLPATYRDPLVLCYLEGKTQAEAARLLGWRLGTLATRVLRGRERLRALLARRGVALSGAALTLALAQGSQSAELPVALVRLTIAHAAYVAAGTAHLVPVSIQVLVAGVLHTMKLVQIRKVLLVAVVAIVFGGVALMWQQGHARDTVAEPVAEKEPTRVLVPQGDKDAAKKDLDLLQGTWNIDAMGWGGKDLPRELMTGYKFVFAGNKLTWEGAIGMTSRAGKITANDGAFPCDFKIDPSQEPKQIDITLHRKNGDGTVLGIYEIKGDTLKVCYYSSNTGRRPTEFDNKDKGNMGFVVLTRAKKPAVLSPKRDKDAAKKDLESLQGTWNIDAMGWGANDLPRELMTGYKFVFAGNKLIWEAALGMMSRGAKITANDGAFPCDFKIDPSQEPRQIDITLHLKNADRTILGIYEIKGDTLKVCYYGSNTGRRPTDFDNKDKGNIGLIVLTRAKKFNQTRAAPPGSTLSIKVAVATAAGKDVSSAGVAVTALGIAATTDTTDTVGAIDPSQVGTLMPPQLVSGSNTFTYKSSAKPYYSFKLVNRIIASTFKANEVGTYQLTVTQVN